MAPATPCSVPRFSLTKREPYRDRHLTVGAALRAQQRDQTQGPAGNKGHWPILAFGAGGLL